jgi:hypothetical protein
MCWSHQRSRWHQRRLNSWSLHLSPKLECNKILVYDSDETPQHSNIWYSFERQCIATSFQVVWNPSTFGWVISLFEKFSKYLQSLRVKMCLQYYLSESNSNATKCYQCVYFSNMDEDEPLRYQENLLLRFTSAHYDRDLFYKKLNTRQCFLGPTRAVESKVLISDCPGGCQVSP